MVLDSKVIQHLADVSFGNLFLLLLLETRIQVSGLHYIRNKHAAFSRDVKCQNRASIHAGLFPRAVPRMVRVSETIVLFNDGKLQSLEEITPPMLRRCKYK